MTSPSRCGARLQLAHVELVSTHSSVVGEAMDRTVVKGKSLAVVAAARHDHSAAPSEYLCSCMYCGVKDSA